MKGKSRRRQRAAEQHESGSSSEDDDRLEDKQAMLAALEAHGRAFLGLASDGAESSAQGARRASASLIAEEEEEDRDDFHSDDADDGWGAKDDFVSDSEDELSATGAYPCRFLILLVEGMASRSVPAVPEFVYAPLNPSTPGAPSKAERRAFLVRLEPYTSRCTNICRTGLR